MGSSVVHLEGSVVGHLLQCVADCIGARTHARMRSAGFCENISCQCPRPGRGRRRATMVEVGRRAALT